MRGVAGQTERYLLAQLVRFREAPGGTTLFAITPHRSHPVMDENAKLLGDADLRDLAAYYSALPCGEPSSQPGWPKPSLVDQCLDCHGDDARARNLNAIPMLFGQNAQYLANQLKLFRATARGDTKGIDGAKRFHPIMDRQSVTLVDQDIVRLAGYFSSITCRSGVPQGAGK